MAPSAAPPSPQEISRKLSVHSAPKTVKTTTTEADPENQIDLSPGGALLHATGSSQPLSAIAERPDVSGGDDSEEEEDEEGGWKTPTPAPHNTSKDEGVLKAGYLWKKGERRKTWKKRWFVLRPAHLAYYKTAAEYQLLRLLELSDVHSCSKVALKKHDNTFGLVSPVRTFYLQAKTQEEVEEWVNAIETARNNLLATSTQNSASTPIPIPGQSPSHVPVVAPTPSPPSHHPSSYQNATSSDSEDASPHDRALAPSLTAPTTRPQAVKDPAKTVLSGYLMKCGSKRRNWRKRWFVLTGEKLMYSASHMDTKPHRQFAFSEILDAFEVELPSNRHGPPPASSPAGGSDTETAQESHTFKIITTKRTLLLCAPGEEEEIKWLGAVRALMARRSHNEMGKSGGGSSSIGADSSPSSSGFTSGSSGIKTNKSSRRLSATIPTALANVIIEEESAQEK